MFLRVGTPVLLAKRSNDVNLYEDKMQAKILNNYFQMQKCGLRRYYSSRGTHEIRFQAARRLLLRSICISRISATFVRVSSADERQWEGRYGQCRSWTSLEEGVTEHWPVYLSTTLLNRIDASDEVHRALLLRRSLLTRHLRARLLPNVAGGTSSNTLAPPGQLLYEAIVC